jgi:hypothetical protein
MRIPDEEPQIIPAYYDDDGKDFWVQNTRGNYMRVNETTLKQLLKREGFEGRAPNPGAMSDVDEAVLKIKLDNHVSYAGPIAGYERGAFEAGDDLVLVTSSPTIIQPGSGEFPIMGKFLENLFGDELDWFVGWIKCAYECLYHKKFRPGQVLAMVGPVRCGKSLLQRLLTIMLGGREALPWAYFIGKTDFNSELFRGEHLMIGDEIANIDMSSRRNLGAKVKQIASERVHRCHKKGKEAIALVPFWRCTMSMNEEDEQIMVLPPLDDDHLRDKLMLLRCHKAEMPMPTYTPELEEEFMATLLAEMPAFLGWLLEIEIPEHMQDARMGIHTHRNEELLGKLRKHAPEEMLWNLCLHCISETTWEGSAQELEDMLCMVSGKAASHIFKFSSACSVYLGRLAGKGDGRVVQGRQGSSSGPAASLQGWTLKLGGA